MKPQITVGRLLIAIGVVAIVCSSLFAADSVSTRVLFAAYVSTLLTRWRRLALRWCPGMIVLAVIAATAYEFEVISACIVALAGFLACAMAAPFAMRKRDGRYAKGDKIVVAVSLLCIVSVLFTLWPLKLAFAASRPAFEAFARRVEAGYRPNGPEKVGRYLIREVEIRDGRPCLWVDPNPGGPTGFVRNPFGGVNSAKGRYPNTAFNLWSYLRLDGDWAYISED